MKRIDQVVREADAARASLSQCRQSAVGQCLVIKALAPVGPSAP
ncbi:MULTISPECIES: hypothetical protein [Caulobacter]|nr:MULTISPECIES: hypothetical protein [Caulobacter]